MKPTALAVTLLILGACRQTTRPSETPPETTPTVVSVAVAAASPFTAVGQAVQLTATATMSNAEKRDVTTSATWQSSDLAVLTISSSGLATSVSEGQAKVTATYQSVAGSSDLTVRIRWSVRGRLVANPDGTPISGASLTTSIASDVVIGTDGTFAINGDGAPANTVISVAAPGFLSRTTRLGINGARTGVDLDLISMTAPFSLTFYREFVRGVADNTTTAPIRRWETSPSFYIKTTDHSGVALDPTMIAELIGAIPGTVARASGGRLTAARIESGPAPRPLTPGWIIVEYTHEISSCGRGVVGGGSVQINTICSCLGTVAAHEITHAMGFWHHTSTGGLMSRVAPTFCGTALNDLEAFHANIAFSRPTGNTDPDVDPANASPLAAGPPQATPLSCWPVR